MKELFLIEDRKDFFKINLYWVLSIVNILLLSTFSKYVFDFELCDMAKLFDVEHYLNIALHGYNKYYEVAFFPLFPLVIRFFNLFKIPILGTVIFNNILCLLSSYLIYIILNKVYGASRKICMYGVLFWLLSPIRVFTFVAYTESLYLFLSFLSFYLYKKRANSFVLGVSIGLGVATRNMGCVAFFVIFAFLFIEMIKTVGKSEKIKKLKYILKVYIPATIISCLYPTYLYFLTGNWTCFVDVQYEYWARVKGNFIKVLLFDIVRLTETTRIEVFLMIVLTYLSLILVIWLMLCSLLNERLKKIDLMIIIIVSLILMFSTYRVAKISAGSTSFFRYIYGLMPIYLLLDDDLSETLILIMLGMNTVIFGLVTFLFLGNRFLA